MNLHDFFTDHPKAAIGFSGGVDSAYLLWTGVQAGADIQPYFVKTAFQPVFELEDARKMTEQLGLKLKVIELDILAAPCISQNPSDRCYYCKKALFMALKDQAHQDGYTLLLDGTNASDDSSDRPGMRALQELRVCSPLRECGLTKQEIRRLSKKAGIFTWDKPAYACLATRIQTNHTITAEDLQKVEKAENALYDLGFTDLRVRIFHGAARVQLPREQMAKAAAGWNGICLALEPYFEDVFLDLQGRKIE